ncbi:MAG: hypothetical protein ACR2PZ_21285 [Pseudomonadales bacterium]
MKKILNSFFARYRSSILWIGLLSACAAGLQAISLIVAFDYVTLLITESSRISYLKQWFTGALNDFLIQIPCLIFVMLGLSALLSYRARDVSVRAMIAHELHCIRELVETIHRIGYLPTELTQADIVRLASKDIRQYGRLVDALLDACLPIAFFVAALGVLFYLAPLMTIAVFGLIFSFLVIFYRMSRSVTRLGIELEESAKPDIGARKRAIETGLVSYNDEKTLDSTLQAAQSDPDINDFLKIYAERLRISFKAILVSSLFLAILIPAVLFFLGRELSEGRNVVADVLIYVVALNFCLVQVRSMSAVVTKIRVFQPFAERYVAFVESMVARGQEEYETDFQVRLARLDTGKLVESRTFRPGECFGVLYNGKLDKIALGKICYALGISSAYELAPAIIHYEVPGSFASIQKQVDKYKHEHEKVLEGLGCTEIVRLINEDLSTARSNYGEEYMWDNLHRRVGFVLQVVECALDKKSKVAFIEGKSFRGTRQVIHNEIKELLHGKVQILVYPVAPPNPIFSVDCFFSCEETSSSPSEDVVEDLETI